MTRLSLPLLGALVGLVALLGCDAAPDADAGTVREDAGARDGGGADAGARDAGGGDAGVTVDAAAEPDAGPPDPPGPWTVYVTVGSQDRLAVVDLTEDGAAAERAAASLALPSSPGPMAHDRAGGRLFVGMAAGGAGIATVALDAAGVPALLGTTNAPNPVYLAVAPGARLLSAYFGRDELRVHDAAGAPPHARIHDFPSDDEPHAATIGPSGLIYVPHRTGGTTWWLRLLPDGALEQVGALASEPGVGPRHIAFHPSGEFAYVVNEFEDSVSSHAVAADGALSRLETVSALAGGPDDANSAADIHVTEDGRFVYSSNRGDDSIARFAIAGDGRLTFLGATPTEARPRELELTEGGGFLLALGQGSGAMAVYRVEADGDLTMVDRVELGAGLLWAIAIAR